MALGEVDHLVVSSATLSEGVAYIEDLLGVSMSEEETIRSWAPTMPFCPLVQPPIWK